MGERWQLDSLLSWNVKMIKLTKRRTRLIFTHDKGNPALHMWLKGKSLIKNEKAKKLGDKMQISFSQPKNIKRIATQKKKEKITGRPRVFQVWKVQGFLSNFEGGDTIYKHKH